MTRKFFAVPFSVASQLGSARFGHKSPGSYYQRCNRVALYLPFIGIDSDQVSLILGINAPIIITVATINIFVVIIITNIPFFSLIA